MKLYSEEYDPATGITEKTFYEEPAIPGGKGKITIQRFQDVEGTLNLNKAEYNNHGNTNYRDSEGGAHRIARIPFMILEKWLREEGFDWYNSTDKERRAKLNHPENRFLLVRPGKL